GFWKRSRSRSRGEWRDTKRDYLCAEERKLCAWGHYAKRVGHRSSCAVSDFINRKKKRASINEARKRLSAKNLVRGRNDADEASATALVFELHVAGDESKQRVVLALIDVFASLMLRAALAHEDRARVDELAAEPLYAKPLTV